MTDHAALEAQIGALHDNVSGIRTTLDKMAEAITRLAVLEERGTTTARDIKWAHDRVDRVAERVKSLEEANIRLAAVVSTLGKTAKVFWAVFGASIIAAATAVIKIAAA